MGGEPTKRACCLKIAAYALRFARLAPSEQKLALPLKNDNGRGLTFVLEIC
jgi:hypothetical protein